MSRKATLLEQPPLNMLLLRKGCMKNNASKNFSLHYYERFSFLLFFLTKSLGLLSPF